MNAAPDRYLRVRPAASYLGIAPRTLATPSWRKKHGIPVVRIGKLVLFDRLELDAYMRDHAMTEAG